MLVSFAFLWKKTSMAEVSIYFLSHTHERFQTVCPSDRESRLELDHAYYVHPCEEHSDMFKLINS